MKKNISTYYLIILLITNLTMCVTPERRKLLNEVPEDNQSFNSELPISNSRKNFSFEEDSLPPLSRLVKINTVQDWNSTKEGLITPSIFQIKVTSLKPDKFEAYKEAIEVAKRKAFKNMSSVANPYLTPEGKVDIKILIEEYGTMIAMSDYIDEKFYFIYQVRRPALEIILKEKLK
jgi:hypothetical protein